VVVGFSDHSNRKYLKILTNDLDRVDNLLINFLSSFSDGLDIYAKVKKNNPLKVVLEQHSFIFSGSRGREILLVRKNIY